MAPLHPDWLEYRRKYFIRPNGNVRPRANAHLSIRHDAHRFMPPGSPRYVGKDVVRYFWSGAGSQSPTQEWSEADRAELLAIKSELADLIAIRRAWAELQAIKRELAEIRFEIKFRRLLRDLKAGFNPNQPRVPAGSREGGQWTNGDGGGADRVRLAAADGPNFGRVSRLKLLLEVAKKVLDAYRSKEGLWDLFGHKVGAVTYTEIDGKVTFGANSSLPSYGTIDRIERDRMIARYAEENPEMAEKARLRQMPVDAFGHAETNVLLRAARENGGTLQGRTLQVFGDRVLCNNCKEILPFVGMELGNPTVTFFDSKGEAGTIKDGIYKKASGR
jgi:hypothetical protein